MTYYRYLYSKIKASSSQFLEMELSDEEARALENYPIFGFFSKVNSNTYKINAEAIRQKYC